MRKNCETCKHDDAGYPSYPLKTPCNECVRKKGCDTPTEWEAAAHYKPDTHADRIRAMSDEELAEFLSEYQFCDMCDEGCDACTYHGECDKRLLEWLKQPAEDSL